MITSRQLQAFVTLIEKGSFTRAAEAMGVFGVPSFIVDGELYWGQEHLDDIREILRRP